MSSLLSTLARPQAPAAALEAEPAGEGGLTGLRRSAAIACVLAALVLVVLDAALANLALPAIALALRASPAQAVRVVTAYQLALVMALFPSAALAERFGYRRVYGAGLALFAASSALCALAPSLAVLVAARFVQGLGGAAILSLGVALLRSIVPRQQLGAAIAWNTLAVALSSAAGPALGALVLASASWPWLFATQLPLGALVLLASRALPDVPGSARELDPVSALLSALAFAGLLGGAELVAERAALAGLVWAAAATAMFALVRRELPRPQPLIPLDLLRSGSFRISVIASVCCFVGQSAALISLPFLLHAHGWSVLQTGWMLTPWPLAVALVAPVAARLAQVLSGAWLCALGGTLLALGLAATSLWPAPGGAAPLVLFLALSGAGFGLFQVSNNRNLFLSAPPSRSAAAGSLQSTARLTGQALGGVLMTALFTLSPELAPRRGLGVAALLTLVAGLVSVLRAPRRSRRAAETLPRPGLLAAGRKL